MSKALIKDTLRTIRKNFSRFVSIMLIIALGTAFFVGIKATAPDMFETAEKYFTDYNLFTTVYQKTELIAIKRRYVSIPSEFI